MRSILVSIINYQTADLTLAAIESVLADAAGAPEIEVGVVVIDNASGDGSTERIAGWIDARPGVAVRLIPSPRNGGFAAGHNLGIAAGASEGVLVLNSDAELRPGCLSELARAAAADPSAGLIAPRLEDPDGTVQTSSFRFPSVASELIRGAGSGPVTRALARWDIPLGPAPDPDRIEWASFACILLRRAMIDAIGPMDEGYFLYFEDVEYARRARHAGWGLVHVPAARAVHHRGGSGPVKRLAAAKRRLPRYYYASRTRYFWQMGGRAGLYAANLAWCAGRALAQGRRLAGRGVPATAAGEFRDIWIGARQPAGGPPASGI